MALVYLGTPHTSALFLPYIGRQAVDRCFETAEALRAVFYLTPNLDTYNALVHVLGTMRAVR